jgi:hypothetical protein
MAEMAEYILPENYNKWDKDVGCTSGYTLKLQPFKILKVGD